jgi:glutamyl-tRNA reductase
MAESCRKQALEPLVRSEGIDEIFILSTCDRTEFIFWASDPAEGANSVLRFLTREFNLKLSEWSNFYRLMDDNAVLHLFEVASGLDSIVFGEQPIADHLSKAWITAQQAGTVGRILDTVMQKALGAAHHARTASELMESASLPSAAIKLAKVACDTIQNKKVTLIGAGTMSGLAARLLKDEGVENLTIVNRTPEHAHALAQQQAVQALPIEALKNELLLADIVMNCAGSPEFIISREQLESMLPSREKRPLVLIDLAVPRAIDASVRELPGTTLYDMDDLGRVLQVECNATHAQRIKAEAVLQEELNGFRSKLMAEQVVPTIVALRNHLEEICGQELRSLEDQYGPFTVDQQSTLHSLASHITQRIANTMARELKGLPEKADQQLLTEAVQRLFHLQPAKAPVPAMKN